MACWSFGLEVMEGSDRYLNGESLLMRSANELIDTCYLRPFPTTKKLTDHKVEVDSDPASQTSALHSPTSCRTYRKNGSLVCCLRALITCNIVSFSPWES